MKTKILELIANKIETDIKERKEITKRSPLRRIGDDTKCIRIIILQELRSEIEAMEEWIPVTERLPENNKDVIWISEGGNYYYDNVKSYHKLGGVTHWMPLPPSP